MPTIDKILNACIFTTKSNYAPLDFLVYCVGVNARENPKSGVEVLQSNIYYYVRINEYVQ